MYKSFFYLILSTLIFYLFLHFFHKTSSFSFELTDAPPPSFVAYLSTPSPSCFLSLQQLLIDSWTLAAKLQTAARSKNALGVILRSELLPLFALFSFCTVVARGLQANACQSCFLRSTRQPKERETSRASRKHRARSYL